MANKLSEENIKLVCEELGIEPSVVEAIIFKTRQKDDEEKASGEKEKKEKKDWLVVINDPDGNVPDELQVWVLQKDTYIDEDTAAIMRWGDLEVGDRLKACCNQMRNSQKMMRKLGSIDSLADIFEFATSKMSKAEGLVVKTRQPVSLIRVNGQEIIG